MALGTGTQVMAVETPQGSGVRRGTVGWIIEVRGTIVVEYVVRWENGAVSACGADELRPLYRPA
ncbi:hypothetical protein USB125703_00579 [Pseudoclavibacter triregionum]|nr:hypothetical protein USB125703_00579 [Pseudoclavibacter triregionum]